MKKKSAKYSVSYSNDGKELLKVDENYQGEFVVPEGVVSIGEEAFMGCEGLTSVVLPESVVFIRDRAFFYCDSLSSINLPSSLLEIGDNAFECCTFETINLPESLTYIGNEAFRCCYLKEVVLPKSITTIPEGCFFACYNLKSVAIPESVLYIENGAFSDCTSLTSITVAEGNPKYDSRENCNAIIYTKDNTLVIGCASTIIPDSVKRIGGEAFFGCTSLVDIVIPNSVEEIGDSAFSGCSCLTDIVIPDSVEKIENEAFLGCESLTSVEIPCSVVSIACTAFWGCFNLTYLKVDPNNSIYDSREDCSAIIETATNTLVAASSQTKIPATVTKIGSFAFTNGHGTLFVPKQITSIASQAFDGWGVDELHFESDCPSEIEFCEDAIPANISVIVPPDTAPIYSFHEAFSHRGLRIEAEELPEPEWDWEAELKKMESEPKYIDWEVYEWEWEDDISEGDEMWGKLFLS